MHGNTECLIKQMMNCILALQKSTIFYIALVCWLIGFLAVKLIFFQELYGIANSGRLHLVYYIVSEFCVEN
jgi:hypothetical protein